MVGGGCKYALIGAEVCRREGESTHKRGRRCAAEGAPVRFGEGRGMLWWVRAYGSVRAQVRTYVGGGAEMCGGRCAAEGAPVWVGAGRKVLLWWRKRALIGAWGW